MKRILIIAKSQRVANGIRNYLMRSTPHIELHLTQGDWLQKVSSGKFDLVIYYGVGLELIFTELYRSFLYLGLAHEKKLDQVVIEYDPSNSAIQNGQLEQDLRKLLDEIKKRL